MKHSSSRRDFFKQATAASLAVVSLTPGVRAMEPIQRPGKPRFPLSLAAYSFRDFFKHKEPGKRITLFDFIDYCADRGLQGTELTSYYFPEKLDSTYLLQLKRHAFLRGIDISGTAVGNNFAWPKGDKRDQQINLVKQWIDYAAILGAPHIRVFAGPKGELDLAEAKKICIATLEECAAYAGTKGVFLGVENHGGIVAEPDDLLEIIRAVQSPWVGINLDTGNFQTPDPYADLAKCAPYAVNVQIKVEMRARGKGKELVDLPRIARLLSAANYQGYVALEYEAAEDPWKAIPGWLDKMKAALAV